LPFLTSHENINKYVRIYVDAKIPNDSTNIFEAFSFYNLYNPALENSLGVLLMEGQLSDYTTGMDFSDVLKMYRTELI